MTMRMKTTTKFLKEKEENTLKEEKESIKNTKKEIKTNIIDPHIQYSK